MASIFAKIISGEIPSSKVYEDELTLAFMDINPASRGHTLVICKEELPDIFSLTPELLAATAYTTQRVARALRETLHPDGFNIIQNNGSAAGQVVFHYHVHVIPRWESDGAVRLWRPGSSTPEELTELAKQIQAAIPSST